MVTSAKRSKKSKFGVFSSGLIPVIKLDIRHLKKEEKKKASGYELKRGPSTFCPTFGPKEEIMMTGSF